MYKSQTCSHTSTLPPTTDSRTTCFRQTRGRASPRTSSFLPEPQLRSHPITGYYLDFVTGNADFNDSGCSYTGGNNNLWPGWVLPDGSFQQDPRQSECYPHDSLVTDAADCSNGNHCDRGLVTWAYYTRELAQNNTYMIWDAPAAIPEVCYGQTSGTGNCGGTEWSNHVRVPGNGSYGDAPIFDDLYNCNLPQVSWVIPDGAWSDHPRHFNSATQTYGPSWVGDIIDAVGEGMTGSTCNPHSTNNAKYWVQEPTLILVVWDDWGGWFDHVPPPAVYRSGDKFTCPTTVQPNGWGCGYTYGFRVPLLVVSPWTGTPTQSGYTGYVSGACGASPLPPCPNKIPPYIHDFGSILRFTELNFGMPLIDAADNGYADANAPDLQPPGNVPLSDFFPLPVTQPRTFTHINTVKDYKWFQKFYSTTNSVPEAADTD
jgi:Phosphoesterase family